MILSSKGQNPLKTKKSPTPVIYFFLGTGAYKSINLQCLALIKYHCASSTVLYMQVALQPLLRLKTSKLNELSFMVASGGQQVKKDLHVKVGT